MPVPEFRRSPASAGDRRVRRRVVRYSAFLARCTMRPRPKRTEEGERDVAAGGAHGGAGHRDGVRGAGAGAGARGAGPRGRPPRDRRARFRHAGAHRRGRRAGAATTGRPTTGPPPACPSCARPSRSTSSRTRGVRVGRSGSRHTGRQADHVLRILALIGRATKSSIRTRASRSTSRSSSSPARRRCRCRCARSGLPLRPGRVAQPRQRQDAADHHQLAAEPDRRRASAARSRAHRASWRASAIHGALGRDLLADSCTTASPSRSTRSPACSSRRSCSTASPRPSP